MIDEELIAFLRDLPFLRAAAAADRIEALKRDKKFILEERDRTFALMLARTEALTTELSELQGVFDFQWRAHMRAVEMWRTANPGNDLVLPDSAKLTVWMLEQLEAARADAKEAEAYAEGLEREVKQWHVDCEEFRRDTKAAEAKLAKAVEGLNYCINAPFSGWTIAQGYARATLAEIESSPPYGLEGEKT